jgi:hypothetical protein
MRSRRAVLAAVSVLAGLWWAVLPAAAVAIPG